MRRLTLLLAFLLFGEIRAVRAQETTFARPAAEARLPGLNAASGLFRMPSAYVQRSGESTTFAARAEKRTDIGTLLGMGKRGEIGLAVGRPDTGSDWVIGSAKFNLAAEGLVTPALSVGVLDAFDASRDGRSGYVVASKYVIPYFLEALTGRQNLALKLHAGYGGGQYRESPVRRYRGMERNLRCTRRCGHSGRGNRRHVAIGTRYYRRGVGMTLVWQAFRSSTVLCPIPSRYTSSRKPEEKVVRLSRE